MVDSRKQKRQAPLSQAAPDLSPEYDATAMPRYIWDWINDDVHSMQHGRIYPNAGQKYYAEQCCMMLNKNYHHDGRWQVIWTEPVPQKYDPHTGIFRSMVPNRLIFSWFMGKWGDTNEKKILDYIIDEDFDRVLEYDPKEWMLGASGACDQWVKQNLKEAFKGDDCMIYEAKDIPLPGSESLKPIQ